MKFSIEKKISNFIENQFPRFYQEEGENFILFTKAYYEWMETTGNPIAEARKLLDYRDIDNTLDAFLQHFQTKYLYGIPFDVIINKRFLLKHILDVYRSKGSIQCYKLLFKLIYNEDVTVYLPSDDMLRISDGTWIQPKYLEINDTGNLNIFVGKKIVGVTSGTSAIVENVVKNPINQGIVCNFAISNVLPNGGTFTKGEKITIEGKTDSISISTAPVILGSLDHLNIVNGGQNFQVGDILKIAHYEPSNNQVISSGVDGRVRVTKLATAYGAVNFTINYGGFGYLPNSHVFVYNADGDTSGTGASFTTGNFSYVRSIKYNTDLICDYSSNAINSVYNFPGNLTANLSTPISSALRYTNTLFGSIATLNNIVSGNNYIKEPYVFVRSTQLSNTLPGTVSTSTSSNTVTGTGTNFTYYFSAGDVIAFQANSIAVDYQVIRNVDSDTSITLYGPPKYSNTVATFRAAPVTLTSNFANYDPTVIQNDNTIAGKNEIVVGTPSFGNNIVAEVTAIGSGKGYLDYELVKAYRLNALSTPAIASGGTAYSNNDALVFTGGIYTTPAAGYVTTDNAGVITAVVLTQTGSGFTSLPAISVKSTTGSNAVLTSSIVEYDTTNSIQGRVVKKAIGRDVGYWSTTQGFLNSDKYIQDSYFYQDYSYQIRTNITLDKYKNILYNTFHVAGSELFGDFYQTINESLLASVLYESNKPIIQVTSDSSIITADSTITVDALIDNEITVDITTILSDSTSVTSDSSFF